MYNYDLYTMI